MPSERLFLDANVLFSAAYREDAGLRRLWELPDVTLLTSRYALEEARRNLEAADQRRRLEELADDLEVVAEARGRSLPDGLDLPEKDRPILRAALHAGATHLVTGDHTHFGPWFGSAVAGVRVVRPAQVVHS